MPNSKQIVYLSQAQYAELIANGSITVNGVTVEYNENDLYVTPQAEPIIDVKIKGTSIGSDGIANIPQGSTTQFGVAKYDVDKGIEIYPSTGVLQIVNAYDVLIKAGSHNKRPITPNVQHLSTFYGLAKAAGHDEKDSTESLGTYTDGAKAAIQNMLGITDLISTEESSTATAAHALNSTFMMNGKLHRATTAIAIGDAVEIGANCEVVKADEVFVKNTDYACNTTSQTQKAGIIGVTPVWSGIRIAADGGLYLNLPNADLIKIGTDNSRTSLIFQQHLATFYGLAKAAGADEKDSTLPVGQYTDTAKTAIRNMLGATSSNVIAVQDEQPTDSDTKVWLPETEAQGIQVPTMDDMNTALAGKVSDVQIDGTSIISNGVANIPIASQTTAGVIKIINNSTSSFQIDQGYLLLRPATDSVIKNATNSSLAPIVAGSQDTFVFYGLAKAAGDTTQKVSSNAVGTYTNEAKAAIQTMLGVPGDVQVNGTSVVNNGVADIPVASTSGYGVVKVGSGLTTYNGALLTNPAGTSTIKAGTAQNLPIVPYYQQASVFYGLAKAAGDTTQSASSNAVGTYTTEAKAAIHTMLGIDPASIAAQVDIPLVETVSGTTPTITGQPNVRYVCDEVSTISITPPASGSVDVIFESGSTATTMTVPSTVKWPAWFDAEALESNTTYEVLITDGIYGSVMTWAT